MQDHIDELKKEISDNSYKNILYLISTLNLT